MKITKIKTVGFRRFKNQFETELYDITNITGANTKGKTNVLYAIIFGFLGTNLTGDDKVWMGNKKSSNCYVELKFIDNQDIEHTLIRFKNKYDNKLNSLILDGKQISQDELQKFYSDKKLFLSILNTNYFINKKPAEQKELLDKYLPEIDINVVYNKLDDLEKSLLEGVPVNILDYLKELNSNKKMYEDKIKVFRGKVEYAQSIVDSKVEEKITFNKLSELNLARQELNFLNDESNSLNRKNQQVILDNLNNQINNMNNQINELSTKILTDKKYYLSIINESSSCCPMCAQKIENQSKLTTIQNLKNSIEELEEKKLKTQTQIINLKSKLAIEKCKLNALGSNTNFENEKQISLVQNQIKELEQEQLDVERYNSSIDIKLNNIKNAKNDILIFQKQITEFQDIIENIKRTKEVAQKLYINYIEEKMKFATKHLKNVQIKYFTVLKDSGEIKDDFVIYYKNNELKNLSRSETIATSLEFANMFNKISKINIPIFIDDYESCADYDFISKYADKTQLLISQVDKGNLLKITDYNNKNTYTIIKPVIKSFKTIRIYKNNASKIRKVA